MERRGQPPHSAPLSAASGPATRKRPIAVLTLQGSPGEGALVIAGTSWEAKGRGLQADRPLRGADTSPPRLREQLGKFSGAGKPQKRRECDATSPTPVRVGQSNPRQWELFPLSLPAPRCSHGAGRLRLGRCMNPRLLLASSPPQPPSPPTSGSRHQPELCGCWVPLPHSGVALALGPIPPISRSAGPSQLGFGAPCPVPGRGRRKAAEEGGLGNQPQAGRGWGSFAGPRSGAAGPEGAKAG